MCALSSFSVLTLPFLELGLYLSSRLLLLSEGMSALWYFTFPEDAWWGLKVRPCTPSWNYWVNQPCIEEIRLATFVGSSSTTSILDIRRERFLFRMLIEKELSALVSWKTFRVDPWVEGKLRRLGALRTVLFFELSPTKRLSLLS